MWKRIPEDESNSSQFFAIYEKVQPMHPRHIALAFRGGHIWNLIADVKVHPGIICICILFSYFQVQ